MKERKASVLKRVLVSCSSQAKDYGTCIAGKVPKIERDMCLKEFLALKTCMENTGTIFFDEDLYGLNHDHA
ncbi:hypothetical protein AAC387_Pa09g2338 [Persea americana]